MIFGYNIGVAIHWNTVDVFNNITAAEPFKDAKKPGGITPTGFFLCTLIVR